MARMGAPCLVFLLARRWDFASLSLRDAGTIPRSESDSSIFRVWRIALFRRSTASGDGRDFAASDAPLTVAIAKHCDLAGVGDDRHGLPTVFVDH